MLQTICKAIASPRVLEFAADAEAPGAWLLCRCGDDPGGIGRAADKALTILDIEDIDAGEPAIVDAGDRDRRVAHECRFRAEIGKIVCRGIARSAIPRTRLQDQLGRAQRDRLLAIEVER